MSALLFPGQGSQVVGMGAEFFTKFDIVKKIFKQADTKLNYPISKLILEGPEEELQLTQNTQPAILTVSYSIFKITVHNFENLREFLTGNNPVAKDIYDECIDNIHLWELSKVDL